MQLRPQESFPLVYLITDPTDTATYYVRSVIRDSGTGSIIQTVDLTDGGSRRFSSIVQAPSDPSGQGRYIDIVTTAYTDSGYTTKSDNYKEEISRYLVADRWSIAFGGGGGGGWTGLLEKDWEKLKKIVYEQSLAAELANPVEVVNLEPLSKKIDKVISEVRGIDIPEQIPTDLSPVIKAIMALEPLIQAIRQTTHLSVDLGPVTDGIKKMTSEILKQRDRSALDRIESKEEEKSFEEKSEDVQEEILPSGGYSIKRLKSLLA